MNAPPLDHLLSLWFDFFLRPFRGPGGIPILMYHGIFEGGTANRRSWRSTETTTDVFRAQMRLLRDNHYHVVRLSDVDKALAESSNDRKQVVLTFDDGYENFYIHALPVLQETSYPATVFVVTGSIGHQCFNGEPCLTLGEIREMRTAGINFGSHTVSHPQLWHLSRDTIAAELRDSRAQLEDILGTEVRSFAYPFAFPEQDKRFRHLFAGLLREYGYDLGVTTILGTARWNHDRLFLPRLGISSRDDRPLFQAKLHGSYDWLHAPQFLWKMANSFTSGQVPRRATK